MSEESPTCQIHQKYEEIECGNFSMPGDSEGLCILHSRDKGKDLEAFWEAIRSRGNQQDAEYIDFEGVFFHVSVNCEDFEKICGFNKNVSFAWATFTEQADFCGAKFGKRADFCNAFFIKVAYFSDAIFKDFVDFSLATFNEAAYFSMTCFMDYTDFSYARFHKEGTFTWTSFKKEADFSGVRINGLVFFRSKIKKAAFQGKFENLELTTEGVLRFQDLSLCQVKFQGTDLRRVEFYHVYWHHYRGRHVLYDEILLRQDEKKEPWLLTWLFFHFPYAAPPSQWRDRYGQVERLYRHLKINYEAEKDYKNAGDFHYGEMEMHRRSNKWRCFPLYWYNIYRWLSGYGERPSWALGWLAAWMAIFTGLLAWAGLELAPPHVPAFGDSFFYLLQMVTLQRPTWAEPAGFWGKLVAGLSVLLIPGQAALFLLALRNRLGRRR